MLSSVITKQGLVLHAFCLAIKSLIVCELYNSKLSFNFWLCFLLLMKFPKIYLSIGNEPRTKKLLLIRYIELFIFNHSKIYLKIPWFFKFYILSLQSTNTKLTKL